MQSTWYKRASLVDSKRSVTDVKFGPKAHGLILAACSADGLVSFAAVCYYSDIFLLTVRSRFFSFLYI